ncbi:hypothetical protein FHS34_001983 [Streptomyces echinatus]|uniref:Uncharacterized protein n=1 Tax=Streptomyces echinatus TaxID=67293 RepID=A0A7W9PSM4_9ACTN|nr:hypothetical protein [Streptomyces echinatus]
MSTINGHPEAAASPEDPLQLVRAGPIGAPTQNHRERRRLS